MCNMASITVKYVAFDVEIAKNAGQLNNMAHEDTAWTFLQLRICLVLVKQAVHLFVATGHSTGSRACTSVVTLKPTIPNRTPHNYLTP